MKVVVTGAAGFIGSHVAEALKGAGHAVLGLDSFEPYYNVGLKRHTEAALVNGGIHFREIDLVEGLEANLPADWPVEEWDAVIHFAAQPGNSAKVGFDRYVRNNLVATEQLTKLLRARGTRLRLFVNIATSSVYGKFATRGEDALPEPISPYGVTKLAAEQLVLAAWRDAGFPACSLRLFSVYGERERPDKLFPTLMRSIFLDQEFPLFEGSEHHQRSFTYVGDIVAGVLAALDRPDAIRGEIINLGSDTTTSTGEAMEIVQSLMGKRCRIRRLPRRPGDQEQTSAVIDKARQLLGYSPVTRPEDGLKRMVEWYLREIADRVSYTME